MSCASVEHGSVYIHGALIFLLIRPLVSYLQCHIYIEITTRGGLV